MKYHVKNTKGEYANSTNIKTAVFCKSEKDAAIFTAEEFEVANALSTERLIASIVFPKQRTIDNKEKVMTPEFFKTVLRDTIKQVEETLGVKAMEYVRNNNAMHNFEVGAKMNNTIREKVIYGFALKHHISIADIRNDIEKGTLPEKEVVEEKFNDAINYLILEKASVLERIELNKCKHEITYPKIRFGVTLIKCKRCEKVLEQK